MDKGDRVWVVSIYRPPYVGTFVGLTLVDDKPLAVVQPMGLELMLDIIPLAFVSVAV